MMVTTDAGNRPLGPTGRGSERSFPLALGVLAPIGLMVIAAVLRVWQLGHQNLWLDELFTVSVTSNGVWQAIAGTAADTNPPLYFVLQALVTPLLGRSEAAMRVLPVIASVLTVGVVYLLGKRMFSREVGLWAAALFAVSPLSIEYAREARMYSLLMLLSAVSVLAFVALLEKPGRGRAALFGVALAAVAYTHVYGYMVAALFLVPIIAIPRVRRRVGRLTILSYGVAGLLFLPWVLALPTQVGKVLAASSAGTWWGQPVDEIVTDSVERLMRLAPTSETVPSILFASLLLLGMPFHLKRTRDDCGLGCVDGVEEGDGTWTLFAVSIIPVIIGVVISKHITMVATYRNTLVALPAACLLVARGGVRFPRRVTVALLGAVVAFSILALPASFASESKGYWRDATTYVLDQRGTAVIAETYEGGLQLVTYADILGRSDALDMTWVRRVDSADGRARLSKWGSTDEIELADQLRGRDRIVVVSPKWEKGPVYEYMSTQIDWRLDKTVDLKDPLVTVWVR
ncbi:MAG: glycosyltransferase family 39 protein [Coriobacteriia bacterium]|nr:glycosyltransferase family 39 protein [Coriobacteriia bacterium]